MVSEVMGKNDGHNLIYRGHIVHALYKKMYQVRNLTKVIQNKWCKYGKEFVKVYKLILKGLFDKRL